MNFVCTRILAAAAIVLVAGTALADERGDRGDHRHGHQSVTFAVYGDAPYGTFQGDNAEFDASPAFIDAVNADADVSMIIHVGDIHSGKQWCTEKYDRDIFDLWKSYEKPLVYTPGDNEWSDCHKPAEGGNVNDPVTGQPVDYANGNPVANLDLVRSIFFAHPGFTLGQQRERVLSQSDAWDRHHRADSAYVENVMWEQNNVLFVTINLPGGSNNDTDIWYGAAALTSQQVLEKAQRDGANLRWLDRAFDEADEDGVEAVVIVYQADVWDAEKFAVHQVAYEPYVDSVANHTLAFGKPVLMFNGDSHVYKSDNPLDPTAVSYLMHPYYNVPNFHRVVVHGSTMPLEYLKLTITPGANEPNGDNAFGPFSWERVIPNP